jgi:hypothetical protein
LIKINLIFTLWKCLGHRMTLPNCHYTEIYAMKFITFARWPGIYVALIHHGKSISWFSRHNIFWWKRAISSREYCQLLEFHSIYFSIMTIRQSHSVAKTFSLMPVSFYIEPYLLIPKNDLCQFLTKEIGKNLTSARCSRQIYVALIHHGKSISWFSRHNIFWWKRAISSREYCQLLLVSGKILENKV